MKQRVILFLAFLLFLCGGDSAWAQTTVRNEKTLKNSVADVGSVQMTSTTSSPVAYYVRSFSDDGQCVSTLTYCDNYTVIEGSHQGEWIGLGSSDDADDHYYVVRGNVEYKTLNVFGQTHLILEDGAILTCTGGIKVEQLNNQATLYIYSQSDSDSQGRITVTNSYKNAAGIGGSQTGDCGSICIHGGDITTTGGQYGAGIGGGGSDGEVCPSSKAGVVTIMGGKVMATKHYDPLFSDTSLSREDVMRDGKSYGTCSTGTVYWEKNGYDYRFYDFQYFFNELTISDGDYNGGNTTNIVNEGGKSMKRVTLEGRTLYRNGSWNTLCLPFDITPSTDLKDACAVKIFAGSSFDSNSGTLIINFADAATIPAGTPFIIRWNPEMGNDGNPLNSDIVDPYFEYVTLADNPQACATTSTYVDFTGCFEPAILDHDYATTLYLGADGKLHYPDDEMKANSCHAYFKLKDGMAVLPWTQGAVVRAYMLNLNGELRKGDVNKDGDVSISDATTLVNILCDKTIEYDEHANVDGEYGVDENDLTKLVDIILGKVLVEGTLFEEDTEHEVR